MIHTARTSNKPPTFNYIIIDALSPHLVSKFTPTYGEIFIYVLKNVGLFIVETIDGDSDTCQASSVEEAEHKRRIEVSENNTVFHM